MSKPLIISAPEPRSIDLIFTQAARDTLLARYDVVEVAEKQLGSLDTATLARARYILGQPPLESRTVQAMRNLRCIFNVESNLINNMPYDLVFERGIHVVTTGAVFAAPVAEMGLAMALCLARNVVHADAAFQSGTEIWGAQSNSGAALLSGSKVGLIGFGDLGRALARLLQGFRAQISAFDPWLPPSVLREADVIPATLDEILSHSDTVFVVASVTSENKGFLDATQFAKMKPGARFILLSRADVVEFDALIDAVRRGHILAASDVFPQEPLALDHPVRRLPGFLRSAHRAGALDCAFKKMGDMVLEDMSLIDKGLPPMRCKRAERETVAMMRSKPVIIN